MIKNFEKIGYNEVVVYEKDNKKVAVSLLDTSIFDLYPSADDIFEMYNLKVKELDNLDADIYLNAKYFALVIKHIIYNISDNFIEEMRNINNNISMVLSDLERLFYGGWDFQTESELERIEMRVGAVNEKIYDLVINNRNDIDIIIDAFAQFNHLYAMNSFEDMPYPITYDNIYKIIDMDPEEIAVHLFIPIDFNVDLHDKYKFITIEGTRFVEKEPHNAEYLIYGDTIDLDAINKELNTIGISTVLYENGKAVDSVTQIIPYDYTEDDIIECIGGIL